MRISVALSRLFLVGCILMAAAPLSMAQGGRGGAGGGPGGGGRGGWGGGFGGGMGGGGLFSLTQVAEVQAELKIDEDQKKELEAIGKEMSDARRALMPAPADGGRPDMAKMRELMPKMAEMQTKYEGKLEEVLDPKQMDRLLGLFVQRDEIRTLSNAIVAAKLKITDEQKAELAKIEKANGEAMMSAFSGGGGGGGDMREKFQAMRKENEEKTMGVLTAEQKKTMEDMKGPKFEFPQRGPGGPGGPGGGRTRPGTNP
jgi:Spy/CpxP family protein refolding chaperone